MFIEYLKHKHLKRTLTLDQLLDIYVEKELLQSSYSIGTKNNYLSVVKMLKKDAIIQKKVIQIQTIDLQEYFNHQIFSRSRTNAYAAVLTNAFQYAIYHMHIIRDNPMKYVKLKFQNEQQIFSNLYQKQQTITHDQYKKIVSYLKIRNNPHLLPIQIAYYTGLRIGEVVALSWDDIHLEEQYLIVQRAMVFNRRTQKSLRIYHTKKK